MKIYLSIGLLAVVLTGSPLQAYSQDSIIPTKADSPSIVKEIIIKETRWKIVKDTVIIQSDSTLVSSMIDLQNHIERLKNNHNTHSALIMQKFDEGKRYADKLIILFLLLFGSLFFLSGFILFHLFRLSKGKKDDERQESSLTAPDQNNIMSKSNYTTLQKQEVSSHSGKAPISVEKPSLETYNASIYEFVTINDHIYHLRKKETKGLVLALYRYLALHTTDKVQLMSDIRTTNVSDDIKEQFVALVSRIDNFLVQKKVIIDVWLHWEPKDGIDSYESAIRMPEGQTFDEALDTEILGDIDNVIGQQIMMVYKMGYYFPGNTIKPYREKSIVSI